VKRLSILLILIGALAVLAGCGGSNNDSSSNNATNASASTGMATVSSHDGQLVDAKGAALYFNDQDKAGQVMCTGSCTSIWVPLISSGKPTAGSGVSGKLGTVKVAGGKSQVTLDGKPLYTFVEDNGSSKPTGDGAKDAFGGQQFSWHAEADASASSNSSSGSGSSSGGGSNYSY
jgi:predicted lipoprotein with Yx(FWY)xxD motif